MVLLVFITRCSEDNNQESQVLNFATQVNESDRSESSFDSTENSIATFSEKSSSSWYETKDTLIGLFKKLSEMLEEDVSFSLTWDDTTDKNVILRVQNGREVYDGMHEKLVEKGYK